MAILLFADHAGGVLGPATAKALSAAKSIGGDIDILVAGKGCGAAAEAAAKLGGVRKVLLADADHLGADLAEELAALVTPLMQSYDSLIAPATTTAKNFVPRVAAQLDVPQFPKSRVEAPNRFAPHLCRHAIQIVGPRRDEM